MQQACGPPPDAETAETAMRSVTVHGLKIAYESAGDGPPLVLLHGFLADSRAWRPQISALAGSFMVIAWDTPGCGASSDPPEHWRMTQYVDCLAGFLDELAIGAAHVCGLSWGGVLAQEFYGRYRDRVRSLVLADTYAGWRGSLGEATAEERRASCLRDSERPDRDWIPSWIPGLFTPAATAEARAGYEAIMLDFHPSGFRTMSHAVADSDTRPILATVAVPTLLIWGEDDQRSPRPIQEAFSAALPAAPIVRLPAGHVSNVEQPDLFNKALIAFCESVERSEAHLPR